MGKLAQADVIVPRKSLKDPVERSGIRRALYEALGQLGYVESVDKYVADPPDGPFRDSAYDDLDRDKFAVVRIIGRVMPYSS